MRKPQFRVSPKHLHAPQKAFPSTIVMWLWLWSVGKVRAEYAAAAVAHDEHVAAAFAAVGLAGGVEGAEADAVPLETIGQRPGFDELEAWRDEESDFLCELAREEFGVFSCAFFVAF